MRIVSDYLRLERVAEDRGTLPPSFVVVFSGLLLFGAKAALPLTAAVIATRWIASAERARSRVHRVLNAIATLIATAAAAGVYGALVDALGTSTWPLQALPVTAAILAYGFVVTTVADVVLPLLQREAIKHEWPFRVFRNYASYFLGAAAAVAIAELLRHRAWELLPIAAIPLYCAYRAYAEFLDHCEYEHRHREVSQALNQGLAVMDANGLVTIWNDTAERMLNCPRDRVLGRRLADAVPGLAQNQVMRAIHDALANGNTHTVTDVRLPSAVGARALEVVVIPVTDGVTLLWQDVTNRAELERAVKRSEQRLAAVAEGASEGLWAWDLRGETFYASRRWKELIGLPADAAIDRVEDWLARVHPEDVPTLKQALEAHLSSKTTQFDCDHRLLLEDGSYRRFRCRGVAARDGGQRAMRIGGSLSAIADVSAPQEQVRSADARDPLTGLLNRALFAERLGLRLAEFKERPREGSFAAMHIALDRFKVINESLGHVVGDELLTAVARRLEFCLGPGDVLGRLGGDEFAILLNTIGEIEQANAIAFRIQKALNEPFSIGGREVFTSASIGIAGAASHYNDAGEILRDADAAMNYAKSRGKARHELFNSDMHARMRDRVGLENDLRHAVDSNGFEVHYQPIVLLATRRCIGFESLIRWTRNGAPVSPATFIPIAEELGLIESIGNWVLQQACNTFAEWKRQYPAVGLDYITVNVSSRQLLQQNFLRIVERAVDASGLEPSELRLEITETAILDNPRSAAQVLHELRDFGAKIYLDDFGTGYSSLSHLYKLPVDALKIDRSFVSSLGVNDRPGIVESILALARTLETGVVAEGIETEHQSSELERLGCTHAQGFLFSRPLSTSAAVELLEANAPLGPARQSPTLPDAIRIAV